MVPDRLYPPFTFVKGHNPDEIEQKEVIHLEQKSYNKIEDFSQSNIFSGYVIDLIISVYQTQGYDIEFHNLPWARALYASKKSLVDGIFPLVWNKDRDKVYQFSGERVNVDKAVLYVPTDVHFIWKNDFSSLKDLEVGVIRGWSYGARWNTAIKNGLFKTVETNNDVQNFRMLEAGRVTAVAGWIYATQYFLESNNLSSKYKPLVPFETVPMYLGISKTNPKASELIQDFIRGLKKIEANKVLKSIEKKWGVER
nr:transporter substrate-binding domain-containing protein [Spartinivicinus marinus]